MSKATAVLDKATIDVELSSLEAELAKRLQRKRWQDPVVWAREKLGETLWSGQIRIMESVRDYRKTAAATCHEIGKSFSAALLAAWWVDSHEPGEAYVITTAPTAPQVRIILWHEIGRAHSRGKLAGRINQTEWMIEIGGKEESVAIGRKPSDYTPAAFQGKHAPYVLIIVDEANGVRGPLHDSMDSMMANDTSKQLMIGNPDEPIGEFYEACKPNSGFNVVHIGAFDSPNFTGEELPDKIKKQLIGPRYVEERRAKWAPNAQWKNAAGDIVLPIRVGVEAPKDGVIVVLPPDGRLEETHPFWQSKVLGQFPVQTGSGSLIPLSWINAAQLRDLAPIGPNELGLDVGASEAGDPSCLGHRRGPVFRVLYEERQPDTMKTTGRMLQYLQRADLGVERVKVDYIGVGRGVVDRAREQNFPVYPISVGEASTIYSCRICKHEWNQALVERKRQVLHQVRCPKCGSDQAWTVFANLLSQLWWDVRTMFEKGEIDIDAADSDLAEELVTMTWRPNSKGQTVVEYNDDMPSPNRADALLIAFAPVHEEPKEEWLTW